MTHVVDQLRRLVAANREGRAAVDAAIEDAMLGVGLDVERLDYDPGEVPLVEEFADDCVRDKSRQTCLIGRLKGTGSGRSLILFAHPDTEPVERAEGWQTDPFAAAIKGGRMIGWGVADSLAGVAILTGALADQPTPAGDVTVVSAPSKRHRRGIAATLNRGVHADAAVYLHPAESGRGLDDIKAFAPGQLEFEVTVVGRPPETEEPAHTAFAHLAVNPLEKSWTILQALRKLGDQRVARIVHPVMQAAIGRSTNLMITHCEFGNRDRLLQLADICRFRVAVSMVPGERLAEVQNDVQDTIDRAAHDDEWLAANPPRLTWLAGVAAVSTSQKSQLYTTVAEVLAKHGAKPTINPLHTSSDIRNPVVQKNIATVGYGPLCGDLAANGHAGEWVDVQDLCRSTAATSGLIRQWCR